MKVRGKVWKIDGQVKATDLVPARYDHLMPQKKWDECAEHILEDMVPGLASELKKGDIFVINGNLGAGHAHYHPAAIFGCKAGGVSAILCESASTLFQRQAIDQGFPVWTLKGLSELVETGDELELDLRTGEAKNLTNGNAIQVQPAPEIILDILDAGSSYNWALRRVGAEHAIDA